jgi:hypothetical protein
MCACIPLSGALQFSNGMAVKREISHNSSVTHLNQSVKRLALEDEITHHMKSSPVRTEQSMEPVLSISRDDFDQIYEKLDEIGRGGFSTVHKCVNKITREIYAVKVRQESIVFH